MAKFFKNAWKLLLHSFAKERSDLNDEPVSLATIISKLFEHFILHHH